MLKNKLIDRPTLLSLWNEKAINIEVHKDLGECYI